MLLLLLLKMVNDIKKLLLVKKYSKKNVMNNINLYILLIQASWLK